MRLHALTSRAAGRFAAQLTQPACWHAEAKAFPGALTSQAGRERIDAGAEEIGNGVTAAVQRHEDCLTRTRYLRSSAR